MHKHTHTYARPSPKEWNFSPSLIYQSIQYKTNTTTGLKLFLIRRQRTIKFKKITQETEATIICFYYTCSLPLQQLHQQSLGLTLLLQGFWGLGFLKRERKEKRIPSLAGTMQYLCWGKLILREVLGFGMAFWMVRWKTENTNKMGLWQVFMFSINKNCKE